MSNRKMFRYEWIWQKSRAVGFLNAHKMPLRAHENILVFYDALPTYNPQKTKGEPYKEKFRSKRSSRNYSNQKSNVTINMDGSRFPISVIRVKSLSNTASNKINILHPTQKTTALCEYLIRTYTNEGELVLDNCMGSGTTAVAAINTGRHYIGFEKERKYYDIAQKRITDATAQIRLAI